MTFSTSGQQSGWAEYPGEIWDERKPVNWLHDWPFWEWCAATYADDKPILELACGNGRITRQLALAGYSVVAIDINPHFLSRAVAQLPEDLRGRVDFALQDIVQLELEQKFSLAIMADWAFPALLTQADQLHFLRRLANCLVEGGVFAFNTIFPTVRQLGLTPSPDGTFLEWTSTARRFDPVSQVETIDSGGQVIRMRHTTLSEIQLLAQMAGFEIVAQFGGMDKRPLQGLPGDDLTLVLQRRV
jgi:SAM-dependent methyltransferase